MKKKRFSVEQMVTIRCCEAGQRPVPEVAKLHDVCSPDHRGLASSTFYRLEPKEYQAACSPVQARAAEAGTADENAKLKRLDRGPVPEIKVMLQDDHVRKKC